jgi:tight adherence protein B
VTTLAALLLWTAVALGLPGPVATPSASARRRLSWLTPCVAVVAFLARPGQWLLLAVIAVAVCWAGRTLWCRRTDARRADATGGLVLQVCDLVAAELMAGRPPDAALAEAAELWPGLRPVADAARLGGDVPAALRLLADTPGASGLRLLAGAWAVSHRTGSGLAESARRVADAVRRDRATRRVVIGELSSARATSRLVAGLPLLALLMGSGAGADPWTFLLGTPMGLACLSAGLAIGFAGLWWIELIAREATP